MRGRIERFIIVAVLSLVVIGFYSTTKIVFAGGGKGAPFLFIENIFPAPEELGLEFFEPLPQIQPPQTSELFDWNGEGSLFLQLIFELGNKKKVNAITEIEVFVNDVLISDFRVSKVLKEVGSTSKFKDVPTLFAEKVRSDYRFKTEFVVPFDLPEDELKVHLEVRVQVSFKDESPIEARKFVTLLNNQLLGTLGGDSDWIISGNDMHSGVSGNVGIGTTTPAWQLHVVGAHPLLIDNTGSPFNDSILFRRFGVNQYTLGVTNEPSLDIFDQVAQAFRFTIRSNGNVGISDQTPSERLSVGGNITATGTITQGSSRELKENITGISTKEAIETLQGLNPIKFKYKAENTGEEHLGFIAEDVPDLVAFKDRKQLSSMDMTAVLVRVVQEQQRMLQEQQETISALTTKVKELENKI